MYARHLVPSSLALLGALGLALLIARPAAADTVQLAEMTWPEVRAALEAGVDTVLLPFGGTEQAGPHLVLGKHNLVVAAATEQAARRLGRVLVAPVQPVSPAGAYAPADGHMRFAGTLSLRESTYVSLAADLALSLKAHGVPLIAFVADHGQGQAALAELARQLDALWRPTGTRVIHIAAYHGANGQADWLRDQGLSEAAIGSHAGIRDTAELLHLRPEGVRGDRLPAGAGLDREDSDGEPRRATPAIGARMLALKVETIVAAVQAVRRERRP